MKVLHVCQNYYPSRGGPQYSIQQVAQKLVHHYGDEVTVATTNSLYDPGAPIFEKVAPAFEIINGIPVHRYPFFRWHRQLFKYANKVKAKLTGSGLPYSIGRRVGAPASPKLHRAMNLFDGDVIMATTAAYNFSDYPSWRFNTNNPKPFVLHGAIHLHQAPHPMDRAIIRAKNCDCYIANTDFEKIKLIEYGMPADKIITAGIGITAQNFECTQQAINTFKTAHNIHQKDVVVGFVGRLEVGKGVAILVDAIRMLHKKYPHFKLLLAGSTTAYCNELRAIIAKENLPIILIENFDEQEKPLIFHSINIFVLPSRSESFGIVFLEAWACKKPVLAARMGATESLISEGEDGLLFELNDINNLIEKIEVLIDNPALQTTLGTQGYTKVQQQYTWDKVIPKYRQAYLLGIENFKRTHRQNKQK